LRICIISQYFPPDIGGASTRVSNAIKGLGKRGHKIFVVTAFPHYPHGQIPYEYKRRAFAVEGDDNVRVMRVWVPPLPHEGGAKRLIMYISFTLFSSIALPFSGKVDIIWAVSPNYFSFISGLFYKMAKKAPLVLDVVDLWPEALVNLGFLKSKLIISIINVTVDFFYKISNGIITLNLGMKREILKRENNPGKVFIVENVVDLDVFRPLEVERLEFLRNKFVVMYSGNLGPMYDFDTVLEAARNLAHIEDIVFIIRGRGECEQEIKKKIKNLKLSNVLLYTEVLNGSELIEFLNFADVFLLPMKKLNSPDISFPLKIVEYLACGKPVICCAEGETARIVRDSNAGLVIEPENSSFLTTAILKLYKQGEYAKFFGKNGRTFVLKNLSSQKITKKLENIFFLINMRNKFSRSFKNYRAAKCLA
jgi:glycosyltransferase involved in cell wall biosynthesis